MSKDEYKSIQEVNELIREYQNNAANIEIESSMHQRLPSLNILKPQMAKNTRNNSYGRVAGRYASMDSRETTFDK